MPLCSVRDSIGLSLDLSSVSENTPLLCGGVVLFWISHHIGDCLSATLTIFELLRAELIP